VLKQFLFLSLVVLFACSQESKYQPITKDYCSELQREQSAPLSALLAPIDSLVSNKTGVYTLEEGDVSMISRAWLTDAAEKTIDIQYFIFSTDNIGLIAVDYLLRAADRGVQVRLIVDDVMVEADAEELLAIDAHPNLAIKIYNPSANVGKNFPQKIKSMSTDFKGFNQRMHNKTFTVDNRVVITGGRNIADEYFDYDHEYNFRDRDVLLIGKAANEVHHSFEQFWNSKLSVPINELVDSANFNLNSKAKYEYLHQYACNPENFWPTVREKIKSMPETFKAIQKSGDLIWTENVNFISDVPGKNESESLKGGGVTTDSLINLIKQAKKSVNIQSPYLITTELSQQLFQAAVQRGVTVNILTNSLSSTDNLEAFSGYQREREKLLSIGIHVFEFKPDAAVRFKIMTGALQKKMNFTPRFGLHAKSMVIDSAIAVIGTFNLDPRSANLNTECFAVIRDKKIAGDLFQSIKTDRKPENAWEVTTDSNPDNEAGWWKRTNVWFRRVIPKSVL
jgi:phosphatidylserine/phosphatidylglycerophosphate/cardiolipin synthase-like enzyme